MLTGDNVTVRYGAFAAIQSIDFQLREGQWLMLVGPNGAGKTTLIEAISQGIPYSGNIYLYGKDISHYSSVSLARMIGVLSQKNTVGYAYTVEEVVGLGRYAYKSGFLSGHDKDGKQFIEQALDITGLINLRHADMLSLSGGEIQRVFLAQVFAQNPQIMILDEPANHLDLNYQQHIFSIISEWLKQPGRSVISVVHDLSLAKRYGTHAMLIHHGNCIASGETRAVLTKENLKKAYAMDVHAWMNEMLLQWNE